MGANIVGNCAEVYTKVLLPVALCELGMLKVRRVMRLFQHIFCLQLWAFWHFHSSSCLYILFSHRCRVMGDIKASKDCFNFTVTFPPKQRNPSVPTNQQPFTTFRARISKNGIVIYLFINIYLINNRMLQILQIYHAGSRVDMTDFKPTLSLSSLDLVNSSSRVWMSWLRSSFSLFKV